MNIENHQNDNLYKAFGLFIEAFRPYIVSLLYAHKKDRWPAHYAESLNPGQQLAQWNEGLRNGKAPEQMIDYGNLKGFALRFRNELREDFGKDAMSLATWFDEIAGTRNKLAHFDAIDQDDFDSTFIHLKKIAKALKMDELEQELTKLKEGKAESKITAPQTVAQSPTPAAGVARPWFEVVSPQLDIRQGKLDESVFAANLAEVALGNGREVYNNPVMFFSKTYFTAGLKSIARRVIQGLNGSADAENRVISLQTGFGGGKTHTLISLYHLCKMGRNAANSAYTAHLLESTGKPEFESAKVAVFTNTTNDAANGRKTEDGLHIQTIWGEIAYQLGGRAAYSIVSQNDAMHIAPAGLMKTVLENCQPALILIDELADYCVKASARKVGNSNLAEQTISFMQELTEAVAGVAHCMLVVTLPASPQEVGTTAEAHTILNALQKRVSRVGADTQPVADDEIYQVIRRRLFDTIEDEGAVEACASKYLDYYQSLSKELPGHVTKAEYKKKIIQAYPFHPELIDVFRIRWASHHDFQRTRGALRLLAAIVSDLWQRRQSLPGANLLIHSSQVNFANLDALTGQLKKLHGNGYDAVITADVAGTASNAFKIDGNKPEYGQYYLTQGIASVILLNTFGSEGANKGVSVKDIKLNLLSPDGFNHNSVNGALDELEAMAHYLYYAQTGADGKRYWFHTKPNIKILINQAKADVSGKDIEHDILKRLRENTKSSSIFRILVDPPMDEVPEQKQPTLIFLHPRHSATQHLVEGETKSTIERIATKKGNSERIYRNTILFLAADEPVLANLQGEIREYLACQKTSTDYKHQLDKEQLEEVGKRTVEAGKKAEQRLAETYSLVMKHSAKQGIAIHHLKQHRDSLERQIPDVLYPALKDEEWLLESVGLGLLRTHNLLPTTDRNIKAKDVYEAFLRFDDKPMVRAARGVQESIHRYCFNGEYCIAAGDGQTFNRYFLSEEVLGFNIEDDNYWLLDKSKKPVPQPMTPPTGESGPTVVDNLITGEGSIRTGTDGSGSAPTEEVVKAFHALIVQGKVPVERYTELFNYFIAPFTQSGNRVEIEMKFRIVSTAGSPLDESKPLYKNAKEAAKQLGLGFVGE